ncbi:MAG: AbrB/MazE/SpoVT family DNA-binding domain-containing protein [Propionicimonas sp.]|nr:AbrB/MazE/SpoVT family DNA-binding domain-containing protein [Propionicimonas sp.]
MDVATISVNGQITLPVAVRKRMQLGPGDQVVFVENEQGDIVVVRPAVAALLEAQRAFRGAAKEAGMDSEADLDAFVADVRTERRRTV